MAIAERDESPLTAGLFAEDAHLFATTVRDNLLVARGDATDACSHHLPEGTAFPTLAVGRDEYARQT